MNGEQLNAIQKVLDYIENRKPNEHKHFFLDGVGGAGKTFCFRTLYNLLRNRGYKVLFIL